MAVFLSFHAPSTLCRINRILSYTRRLAPTEPKDYHGAGRLPQTRSGIPRRYESPGLV